MLTGTHRIQAVERVIYGTPCGEAVLHEAERTDARRVLITTTKSLAGPNGLAAAVAAALGPRHAGTFSAIAAHSPRDSVIAGAAAARAAKADLIVAVGGGSVVDATKTMLACLWHGVDTVDGMDAIKGTSEQPAVRAWTLPAEPIRMVAVPTTFSAADFTTDAGISDPRRGVKETFGHRLMAPRAVVLDPRATLDTPMWLLLCTGVRAVDHAVEGLCSSRAQPFADGLELQALRLLGRALPAIKRDPQALAPRLEAQFGMWMAISGSSSVGVGASHGIGHVLGAACQVPHGHTSCVMLPSVLRWNKPVNAHRQALVAEAMGAAQREAADLVGELVAGLDQPTRLRDVGVTRDRFREIAEKSMHDRAVQANPRKIDRPEQVMEILELAW